MAVDVLQDLIQVRLRTTPPGENELLDQLSASKLPHEGTRGHWGKGKPLSNILT